MINTHRTVYPEQPEVRDHFNFVFSTKSNPAFQLNSLVVLSSKAILNVENYLEKGDYFRLDFFMDALSTLLVEDRRARMTVKEILYLLRFDERPSESSDRGEV